MIYADKHGREYKALDRREAAHVVLATHEASPTSSESINPFSDDDHNAIRQPEESRQLRETPFYEQDPNAELVAQQILQPWLQREATPEHQNVTGGYQQVDIKP